MTTKNNYWDLFYNNNNNKLLLPSQFATFIANEYLDIKSTVIDIGCGNGRDSLFFMNLGFKVIGIDASKKAIESIQSKLRSPTLFFCGKISDPKSVSLLKDNIDSSGCLVYSRFFLHAITDDEETDFWNLVDGICMPGDILAVEFRTNRDEFLPKVTEPHYRRFIDPRAVVAKGNHLGFSCEYFVEGLGYAKYKSDDAHVARIIFRK